MSQRTASRTRTTPIAPATSLVRTASPEEIEYAQLLTGIETANGRIAELEHAIAPLEQALSRFEHEYQARLGTLVAELRDLTATRQRIEQRTARVHARMVCDPGGILGELFDKEELLDIGEMFGIEIPEEWFAEAEAQEQDRDRNRDWNFKGGSEEAEAEILRQLQRQRAERKQQADPDFRAMYRELARQFHPDLATTEQDRSARQEMMLRINAAWQNRDVEALRRIQLDTEHLAPDWQFTQIARRLAWARRESTSLGERIGALQHRLRTLRGSDTFPLWFDFELGKSVIARQAVAIRNDIARQRDLLEEAKDAFKQALHAFAASSNVA